MIEELLRPHMRAIVPYSTARDSHLEWDAAFNLEKIGDVPTEMFKHFFRSFSDAAKITFHISVKGENEHHKAEAILKGVARALRMALIREAGAAGVPSTKGVL